MRPRRERPPPAVYRRRRAAALAVVIALIAAIWLLFLRGGSNNGSSGGAGTAPSDPHVLSLVGRLSVPEMVDEVLLFGFDGTSPTGRIEHELRAHSLGGVIVGPANWTDRAQGVKLVAGLRAAGLAGRRVPPLIAVQQEGGHERALGDLPPSAPESTVGRRGSLGYATAWAMQAATALRDAGFDLDLFPVADVATPTSPLGERAFSNDPRAVAALTTAAVRGCEEARLACAPLHFPGVGAASENTDLGPATVGLTLGTLWRRDLLPFRAALYAGAPAVVLSLAYYASYDPVTPGALASAIDTDLLRDSLSYPGVAITDDLSAGAITATENVSKAAIQAIAAGADLVQVDDPRDQAGVRAALLRAVESGDIPESRLAEAAARVLELKRQMGLLPAQPRR
jgi:beta-N-acetylhexosaminidase